jgi:uncharacterized tellurite resistance protein B-like protein
MEPVDPTESIPASSAARPRASDITPQEAVATLLIAGARADGSVSPHEANVIEHEIEAMRLFRGCSEETLQSIYAKVMRRISRHGSETIVEKAAAAIPRGLRATVYAKMVDLLLSDGRTPLEEQLFASRIQRLLGIDDHTAAMVNQVLAVKNAA